MTSSILFSIAFFYRPAHNKVSRGDAVPMQKQDYSESSRSGHSSKRTGLLTAAFTTPFFSTPIQNKRAAPVTDTFFAFRECPLMRAFTVYSFSTKLPP